MLWGHRFDRGLRRRNVFVARCGCEGLGSNRGVRPFGSRSETWWGKSFGSSPECVIQLHFTQKLGYAYSAPKIAFIELQGFHNLHETCNSEETSDLEGSENQ